MTLPLLAVDVDGVISLFGFDSPPAPGDLAGPAGSISFELIDGTPHLISIVAGEHLVRLRKNFELIWATGWQDRANDRLGPLLGLPALPVVSFDLPTNPTSDVGTSRASPGQPQTPAHWKLEAIDRHSGKRPLAWVDTASTRAASPGPRLASALGIRPCSSRPSQISAWRKVTSPLWSIGRGSWTEGARLVWMEGFWPIFFLLVVLKVPVFGMIWLLWWATVGRQQPESAEDGGGSVRLRPDRPRRPMGPRRDPHGGGMVLRPEPSHGSRVRHADAVRDRARSRQRARSLDNTRK